VRGRYLLSQHLPFVNIGKPDMQEQHVRPGFNSREGRPARKELEIMGNYQILSEHIDKMQEGLKESQQVMGALHVLVRCALAEADSANAKDAVKTLKMADNLILRGHVSGGTHPGDIVFGRS
jgi:hypothetical protein